MTPSHQSVLLQESIESLNLSPGDTVIDATVGHGGHAEAIARIIGERGHLVAIDADEQSIAISKERLSFFSGKVTWFCGNFRSLKTFTEREKIENVAAILFDLGWNSAQLAVGRGFSFNEDAPLQMTYDAHPESGALTAERVVQTMREGELAEVLETLGEERYAKKFAHAIVVAREKQPIRRAVALRDILFEAAPSHYRYGKIHPATKTFQALRMLVNSELAALTESIPAALELLKPKGRLSIITFHSLEDGLVKRIFRNSVAEGAAISITKKPLRPTRAEVQKNPRARSAKLRTLEKL